MKHSLTKLHCEDSSSEHLTLGETLFKQAFLLELAEATGFYKRSPRKIDICSLLAAICTESVKGSPSCNDLATSIETNNPQRGPSRQAVHLRMGAPLDAFIHRLLEDVIAGKISGGDRVALRFQADPMHFAHFKRVLVQDSTIIKPPAHLFEEFSGVSNGHSKVANARVQATYDLIPQRLIGFSIDPYSKNDLLAAPELPLEAGDLVLRDRGYLTLEEIQRHEDAGADCIYRHKTGTIYLDPESGEPINLAMMLHNHGCLDISVLLNNQSRTPVRLVSAPVSQQIANTRRMRARKETHGHNPSKALLELMGWTVLITTLPPERADFRWLLAVYGLRWRIEVIFKAWKSHMKFERLHRVSRSQMFILLKARLLLVTCCTNLLYRPLETSLWQKHQSRISLLKLINFLSAAPANMLRALKSFSLGDSNSDGFLETVLRYCCYDRRKRPNFSQIYEDLA